MVRDYHELRAWSRSHQLTIEVYQLTARFPVDERYGLVQQMRRSAASIPTNVAEGAGRPSRPEFARFLGIAAGSASELLYQLELSSDLGYLGADQAAEMRKETVEVRAMLTALRLRVRAHADQGD